MNGNGSTDDERVIFAPDEATPRRFKPQVSSFGGIRRFEPDDMQRVLDYTDMAESPADGPLLFCEDDGKSAPKFVTYHFCLRGCFLFYFDPSEVDEASGPYATYHSPPIGVVPLAQVSIEFPPGGRRVFREHAQTNARVGYEFAMVHHPTEEEMPRPPFFLVADSLGKREKWSGALRSRSAKGQPTLLRAGYSTTSRPLNQSVTSSTKSKPEAMADDDDKIPERQESAVKKPAAAAAAAVAAPERQSVLMEGKERSSRTKKKDKKTAEQFLRAGDDADLGSAVLEFGAANFDEKDWMDTYFQRHLDFDAVNQCKQMEHWQADMKKSLKGAVLEQYEYFVQASGEMTTMGREVASLKQYIETQVSTIKEMKDIDFSGALQEKNKPADPEQTALDPPRLNKPRHIKHSLSDDFGRGFEEMSISEDQSPEVDTAGLEEDEEDAPIINIPEWLYDATAEMSALVRECRYNAAVDLYLKAKADIAETIDKHERPTAFRLKKKQLVEIDELQKQLNKQVARISNRLSENLRRKNESLRQASKRDRADTHALVVTNVSPCALNDDMLYLQLLVKLGKTNLAADAYSTRRSLLLFETLHEKPISGAGNVDLVIFAAQLSQSFFSCLATSVEGFLDLFLSPGPTLMNGDKPGDDLSLGESSLHSHAAKNVPAGAIASVVLWCDSELAKFSSAFGGTRILANLALSPPPKDAPKQPRVVGQSADETNGSKERKNAIEIAAQCLDQAFMYASENLDSVGLPLTPRLAEFLRSRLKGCEAEVAALLDERWHNLTVDWVLSFDSMDYPR
jgi:hypothetical protein